MNPTKQNLDLCLDTIISKALGLIGRVCETANDRTVAKSGQFNSLVSDLFVLFAFFYREDGYRPTPQENEVLKSFCQRFCQKASAHAVLTLSLYYPDLLDENENLVRVLERQALQEIRSYQKLRACSTAQGLGAGAVAKVEEACEGLVFECRSVEELLYGSSILREENFYVGSSCSFGSHLPESSLKQDSIPSAPRLEQELGATNFVFNFFRNLMNENFPLNTERLLGLQENYSSLYKKALATVAMGALVCCYAIEKKLISPELSEIVFLLLLTSLPDFLTKELPYSAELLKYRIRKLESAPFSW